jgi:hypothetical protein
MRQSMLTSVHVWHNSLALLEMQIVTSTFFRYFDVQMDPAMDPNDMKMKVVFSGSPRGEKVLFNLRKVSS